MKYYGLVLFIVMLAGCGGQPLSGAMPVPVQQAPSTPDALPQASGSEAVAPDGHAHIVVETTKTATYRRSGWVQSQQLRFGTVLYTGDLIDRPPDGSVVIVCSDLTQPSVQMGINGVPCATNRDILSDGENVLTQLRAESVPLPVVVSPLPGSIREAQPVISWNGVRDTTLYTVSVEAEDGSLTFEQQVPGTTTTLDLAANSVTLVPTTRYQISVMADGNRSSLVAPPVQWVRVLSDDEAKRLAADDARIGTLGLSTAANDMLRARVRRSYGLTGEAAAILGDVVQSNNDVTTLLLLAETHAYGLLLDQAIKEYLQIINVAKQENDTEVLAVASLRLGETYLFGKPSPEKAATYLLEARKHYHTLLGEQSKDPIFDEIQKDLVLAGQQ